MKSEFIKHFLLSLAQSDLSHNTYLEVEAALKKADEELTNA